MEALGFFLSGTNELSLHHEAFINTLEFKPRVYQSFIHCTNFKLLSVIMEPREASGEENPCETKQKSASL